MRCGSDENNRYIILLFYLSLYIQTHIYTYTPPPPPTYAPISIPPLSLPYFSNLFIYSELNS